MERIECVKILFRLKSLEFKQEISNSNSGRIGGRGFNYQQTVIYA